VDPVDPKLTFHALSTFCIKSKIFSNDTRTDQSGATFPTFPILENLHVTSYHIVLLLTPHPLFSTPIYMTINMKFKHRLKI